MDLQVLKYYLVVLAMTSWPVWMVGGIACVVVWRASTTWHPFMRLLARTFLLALTLTPSFIGDCMPAFVPAVLVFIHEPSQEWLSRGVMPLFFGWLVMLAIPVTVAAFQTIYERSRPRGSV